MSEAKVIEVAINCTAGGKVAIEKYGNITSDYGISHSLKFQIPEDWTEEQAKEFQAEQYAELRGIVDAYAQLEHDERFQYSFLNPDR